MAERAAAVERGLLDGSQAVLYAALGAIHFALSVARGRIS